MIQTRDEYEKEVRAVSAELDQKLRELNGLKERVIALEDWKNAPTITGNGARLGTACLSQTG